MDKVIKIVGAYNSFDDFARDYDKLRFCDKNILPAFSVKDSKGEYTVYVYNWEEYSWFMHEGYEI